MARNVFCECFSLRSSRKVTNFPSTYDKICETDPVVQSFQDSVRIRTNNVLSAFENPHESNQKLTVENLNTATNGILETQEGIANIILSHKEDVWKDRYLSELARAFFTTSRATLDFCNAIERSIDIARQNDLLVQNVVAHMSRENLPRQSEMIGIFEATRSFLNAEIPFSKDFMESLTSIQIQHMNLLGKLFEKKQELGKKAKRAKVLAKVTSVIFVGTISAVVISAIVAAAIAAPPVAAALAAAASFPLTAVGSWVEDLLSKYEKEFKSREELVQIMEDNTTGAIEELTHIISMARSVEITLNSYRKTMDFGLEWCDLNALQVAVDNLKLTSTHFMENLVTLEDHVRLAKTNILSARSQVLDKISRHWGRKFSEKVMASTHPLITRKGFRRR